PFIYKTGSSSHLVVDGKPFLILGGEITPSPTTSAVYMASNNIWQKVKATGANTVFIAVTWEVWEPVEGQFDQAWFDQILGQAREAGLRVVIQWFGSLKGGHDLSTYAPTWVKLESERFPKYKRREEAYNDEGDEMGKMIHTTECLSFFGSELAKAEQNAFRALMEHIAQSNKDQQTILMVQIGSQIGFAKDSRDCSNAANAAFEADVPQAFVDYLRKAGSAMTNDKAYDWETFGETSERAEAVFTVYHLASHVETLAKIVKDVHPVPTFTTVPLEDTEGLLYGAPGPDNLPLWKGFAPSIDFYAPRMLHNKYGSVCEDWGTKANQPLLVMAHPQDAEKVRQLWTAFGSYGAFGVATIHMDRVNPGTTTLPEHFGLMGRIEPILLVARGQGLLIEGFSFLSSNAAGIVTESPIKKTWGGYDFTITKLPTGNFRGGACGVVIHQGKGKALAIGHGFQLKAKAVAPEATITRVLSFHKLEVNQDGGLDTLRSLNADETGSGRVALMPPSDP
ncbi:glycoside hydrolase superfamily, partial [Colletotrichum cereale]